MTTSKMSDGAKRIAASKGRGMAPNATPAQLYLSRESIEASFDKIDRTSHSQGDATEARRAAIDRMMETANRGDGWATFYAAIGFVKENDWYWKDKGHKTFESFWIENGVEGFSTFSDLEQIHHFAKMACPELFGVDIKTAKELFSQVEYLAGIEAMNSHGRSDKKNTASAKAKKVFESHGEAMERVVGASTYRPSTFGSNSIERRMARIKRDKPNVAARILAGEFIRKHASGIFTVDMKAAEIAAYGAVRSTQAKLNKKQTSANPTNIAKLIKKAMKDFTPEQIIKGINDAGIVGFKVKKG